MIITLDRQTLLAALTKGASIVSRKNTVPILSHVLIEATKKGAVTFKFTNLDMEATVTVKAAVDTPGATTVSAETLLNIAKNAADGADIVLTLGDKLQVKSGRSRFNLAVLPPVDFPTFAQLVSPAEFAVSGDVLARTINRVAFAQCQHVARQYICGVRLIGDGGQLEAVATDGKAMAQVRRPGTISDVQFAVTLATGAADQIVRLFDGAEGSVNVAISESKIQVTGDGVQITAKLVGLDYPPYDRVIPNNPPHSVKADLDGLATAVRRALVAGDVGVRLTLSPGMIAVTARSQDADAADEVECDYEGEEISFMLHSGQLLATLSACASDVVEIEFSDAASPMLIHPADPAFRAIMIAMRA